MWITEDTLLGLYMKFEVTHARKFLHLQQKNNLEDLQIEYN